jgi:hypothetical protein
MKRPRTFTLHLLPVQGSWVTIRGGNCCPATMSVGWPS